MRNAAVAVNTAYADRRFVQRYLLWITAKDRVTGDPVSIGFWGDFGTITFTVLAGLTLVPTSRDYIGTGGLISVGRIPLTSDISVREVPITLSQINDEIELAVRGYDMRNAPVEIHEAMFDPETRGLVSSPEPLFIGFVDTVRITTPAENQEGSIAVKCVSHTRLLTRASTDVRSNASQFQRSATDNFYQDTGVVGKWKIAWGKEASELGNRKRKTKRGTGRT